VLNGNGVQIFLAGTSHVSLTVRNDGSLCPLTNPAGINTIGFVAPAKVIAYVSPGGVQASKVERVIVASMITDPLPAVGINFVDVTPPPFSKSVRFDRYNASLLVEPLQIILSNQVGGNILQIVYLGANDVGPIPLSPAVGSVRIVNTGASAVNQLNTVFDVTPT